jgi:hypothetical protein
MEHAFPATPIQDVHGDAPPRGNANPDEMESTLQDPPTDLNIPQAFGADFSDFFRPVLSSQTAAVPNLSWTHPLELMSMQPAMQPEEYPGLQPKLFQHAISTETIHLAQQIEDACKSFLRKTAIPPPERRQEVGSERNNPYPSESAREMCPKLMSEISTIGVYLMVGIGEQSPYVYGTGANEFMEKIFRWRCFPSLQNRRAIPEPFRPTTLQAMTMNHPNVIDYVNWPCIRDQVLVLMITEIPIVLLTKSAS